MSATAQRNGRGSRVPLVNPVPESRPEPEGCQLAAAVLSVQAQARKLARNATGQIQSRTYSYVTLDAVVDEVLPLLVEHDLLWRTFPTVLEDGRPGLRYRMTHVPSGETEEDVMPLLCDQTSQGLGSGVTYGRRYSLCAYLNLTVDQDDDGAAASGPNRDRTGTEPGPNQPTARPAAQSDRPASAKQRGMIQARVSNDDLAPDVFANILKVAAGLEPVEWQDEDAAQRWSKRALDRLPARLVDAVLQGIAGASA